MPEPTTPEGRQFLLERKPDPPSSLSPSDDYCAFPSQSLPNRTMMIHSLSTLQLLCMSTHLPPHCSNSALRTSQQTHFWRSLNRNSHGSTMHGRRTQKVLLPDNTQYRSIPPYKSTFIKNPSTIVDAKTRERRRRLFTLANEAFPDGRIPDPYTSVWLNEFDDGSMKDLPSIRATLVITLQDDMSDSPPEPALLSLLTGLNNPLMVTFKG
jgi:hypothetical protein